MVFGAGAFSAFLVESFANADMLHMSVKAKIAVINFFMVLSCGRKTAARFRCHSWREVHLCTLQSCWIATACFEYVPTRFPDLLFGFDGHVIAGRRGQGVDDLARTRIPQLLAGFALDSLGIRFQRV